MNVPTSLFYKGLATNAIGTALDGLLKVAKVGLFTNQPVLTIATVLADLDQPVYTGYALETITWEPILEIFDGSWVNQGGLSLFQMTNNDNPTIVTGCFICNSAGTTLWVAEMFDTPVNLVTSDFALLISPQVAYGTNGWGHNAVIF